MKVRYSSIREFCRTTRKYEHILMPALLCLIVGIFWSILWIQNIRFVPVYAGELKAIDQANWKTMWTWTDYGDCYRYSPTGLLGIGLIDRYFISPWLGIDFSTESSSQFVNALRFVPLFVGGFVVIALLTYLFCRELSIDTSSAFVSGLYFGVNKGFAYYFHFASTIAVVLLAVYAIGVLAFWTRYYQKRAFQYLTGYYVCLFLAVGAWEQWIDLLAFLLLFSMFLMLKNKTLDKGVIIHGVIAPLLIFFIYLAFRYPTFHIESMSVTEAQYVFSYPSMSLMVEDVVVNFSLYIADTFDSLLFPWPMLSQSVIHRYNMDVYNPYNKLYTQYSSVHYRTFTDWYAGFLFAFFLCITAILINYLRKRRSELPYMPVMGLLLVYTGFTIHLPIMYRTYFALPGIAGLLTYKHSISILGASILLGWVVDAVRRKKCNSIGGIPKMMLLILLCGWIVSNNYLKIVTSFLFGWGVYPW